MKIFTSEEVWWWVGLGVLFSAGLTWVALAAPAEVRTLWRLIAIGVGLVGLGFSIVAALRSGVRISVDEVAIVGSLRTTRIPRAWVDRFELQQRVPYIAEAVEVDGSRHSIWVIGIPMLNQDEKRGHFEWIVEQMNNALSH